MVLRSTLRRQTPIGQPSKLRESEVCFLVSCCTNTYCSSLGVDCGSSSILLRWASLRVQARTGKSPAHYQHVRLEPFVFTARPRSRLLTSGTKPPNFCSRACHAVALQVADPDERYGSRANHSGQSLLLTMKQNGDLVIVARSRYGYWTAQAES